MSGHLLPQRVPSARTLGLFEELADSPETMEFLVKSSLSQKAFAQLFGFIVLSPGLYSVLDPLGL